MMEDVKAATASRHPAQWLRWRALDFEDRVKLQTA